MMHSFYYTRELWEWKVLRDLVELFSSFVSHSFLIRESCGSGDADRIAIYGRWLAMSIMRVAVLPFLTGKKKPFHSTDGKALLPINKVADTYR